MYIKLITIHVFLDIKLTFPLHYDFFDEKQFFKNNVCSIIKREI